MWLKNRRSVWIMAATACVLLEAWALHAVGRSPARWRPEMTADDSPAARALYTAMIEALHNAGSLSYVSRCSSLDDRTCTYTIRLKKPASLYAEATNDPSTKRVILTGDGTHLWIHWSGDRPGLRVDTEGSSEQPRSNVYMKVPLTEENSVRSEIARLGLAWFAPILDPGTFHTGRDPLDPWIDGVRSVGTHWIGDEEYDVIEVSLMRAQRTRYFWLSRQDHLPRKIKEIVRTTENKVTIEDWSEVTVNGEIVPNTLAWSPPQDWRQWDAPDPADSLLKPGQEAPDFDLSGARKGRIRLSDSRGKVVWLVMWQVGSPACRREMCDLQRLHKTYGDKGLMILGFNATDDDRIARDFLRENAISFASVLDSSPKAEMMTREGYGNRLQKVPLNYIIDRKGKVVDAWYGYEEGHLRALTALKKAGLDVEE